MALALQLDAFAEFSHEGGASGYSFAFAPG
jgi:hypothetical protein